MNPASVPDRTAPIRVLFVCMGNICRSPMAEGVFRHIVGEAGLAARFEIDSAGIGDWHEGEPPDARATATAASRGIRLEGRARQVRPGDLRRFDYILAMDTDNLTALRRLADAGHPAPGGKGRPAPTAEVRLFREFETAAPGAEAAGTPGDDLNVPDPYYGGPAGFDRVYDMVERSARGLLQHIRQERGL